MIDDHVVELILECLDQGLAHGRTVTLVQLHWYIDARDRVTPSAEEVNEALIRRPHLSFNRCGGSVVFCSDGNERSVTEEDMDQAYGQYGKEFAAASARPRR
jgi:hypothetical protein